MKFIAAADTDIGNQREANEDSILIRCAKTPVGDILLCVICDGLGGLSRGELASATVVRAFSDWFDRELVVGRTVPDLRETAKRWESLLLELNRSILCYGEKNQIHLGTTFSGILFVGGKYLICHVGDSRIYHIGNDAEQLTEDQTLAAQELRAGRLTVRQAGQDTRRNILLQCVGASESVKPQMIMGKARPGVYLLCSDGLCHETTGKEMRDVLCGEMFPDRRAMHRGARQLIELVKSRGETDNISAVIVQAQDGADRRPGRRRG